MQVSTSGLIEKQYTDITLYVPKEAVSAYQSADVWKNFWDIQGIEVTDILRTETTKQIPAGIFDLNGRKLREPRKGVNIINGKKVMVK